MSLGWKILKKLEEKDFLIGKGFPIRKFMQAIPK